jgi:dihydroorotate dehydrogenase (NAD+) catalytic subunit
MNEAGVLGVDVAGVRLRSPVVLAAGACGYLDEMADVMDLGARGGVGGLVTKSITAKAREGNATWRILETRGGMLNAIGLANMGIEEWMRDVGPRVAGFAEKTGAAVFGSIAGFCVEDYVSVAREMARVKGLSGIEINVSCPNVHGGTEFGADAGALRELVAAVREVVRNPTGSVGVVERSPAGTAGVPRQVVSAMIGVPKPPIFVKLSPIVVGAAGATIVDIAKAAVESGASALCLCNTVPAMAVDVRTRKPRLANTTGGLSGPAVHTIAVRLVHLVYRAIARDAGVPIVGIGGVTRWEDAAEFVLAGASAVEMGTALFADPKSPKKVVRGLEKWVREQGKASIKELVGGVEC